MISLIRKLISSPSVLARRANLSFSFGKGEQFWTNLFPTDFVRENEHDIKRFRGALKTMSRLSWIFGLMPVKHSLRLFRFSDEYALSIPPRIDWKTGIDEIKLALSNRFIERMVFPTYAVSGSQLFSVRRVLTTSAVLADSHSGSVRATLRLTFQPQCCFCSTPTRTVACVSLRLSFIFPSQNIGL